MRSARPRFASSPRRSARRTRCTSTPRPRGPPGYRDVIAPPTFAILIAQQCDAQLVTDPEAGIDYSRVVHGEQKFVHHRPLTAGDDVVGVLHVDSVRAAGGHAMVTTRTELSVEGEPVCTAVSTLVIRGAE
jgi:acyl dehydratase